MLSEYSSALLRATDPCGAAELREEIVRYLHDFRGINVSPDNILIGAGSEYLMHLVIQLLGRDRVYALENPGYRKLYQIFAVNGVTVRPTPLDKHGLRADALAASDASVVYLTPSHHFPLGTVMTAARRLEILRWASEAPDRYIIEDDYDSELRYQSRPIPSLQSIDNSDHTIYLGTFSKSMSPDLRISYMVLPADLMKAYESSYSHTNCTVPTVLQLALIEFIQSGNYQRHIGAMKNHYKKKHDYILNYVKQNLEDDVIMYGAGAGLHFVAEVKNSKLTQTELISAFEQKGIRIFSTEPFWIRKNLCPENQLLFGFSAIPYEKLPGAMKAFSKIIHSL